MTSRLCHFSKEWIMPGLILAVIILPIASGLWQTGRAAFGVLPAIGRDHVQLEPWFRLFELPGIATSLRLSFITGLAATVLSLVLAVALTTFLHRRHLGGRFLTPFLAAPHAALAIGLAFILAPSGWIGRLLAPLLDLDQPANLIVVNDQWGIGLIIGLVIKEMPFLLLVILAALTQMPLREHMAAGRSLGYQPGDIWLRIILPQIWPLIRLPFYVVAAYSLSVVDMAIILGPSTPPTLAVMLTRLFADPDIAMILPASAGALLQAGLVILVIALLWVIERLIARFGLYWLRGGGRRSFIEALLRVGSSIAMTLLSLGGLAMLSLLIWSLAWRWSWPHILPQSWSWQFWNISESAWGEAFLTTLVLAVSATTLSLILAIAWLETEDRSGLPRNKWAEALIYLPLLVPQIGFLYGLNILFLKIRINGGMPAVIWAQALFVFPYVMITLSEAWRKLDRRLIQSAAALGAGPWRRLFSVKLPVLLAPILTASAIGIAVSVAQYLPTLFMGGGRISTLTTEAVTLSSASDRRITGVYASLQAILPMFGYLLAFLIPAFLHRNRRALHGASPA